MNQMKKNGSKDFTYDIPIPGKKGGFRRLEFESEADKMAWRKAYRKSKLFVPYFLVGIGINFILYKVGLNLSQNLFWGFIVGVGVPLSTMFILSEVHYRLFAKNK